MIGQIQRRVDESATGKKLVCHPIDSVEFSILNAHGEQEERLAFNIANVKCRLMRAFALCNSTSRNGRQLGDLDFVNSGAGAGGGAEHLFRVCIFLILGRQSQVSQVSPLSGQLLRLP